MADRDPCPHRIIGDVGGAFGFGLAGGGVWHTVKGFRNSPKGQGANGALKAVMVRAFWIFAEAASVYGGGYSTLGYLLKQTTYAVVDIASSAAEFTEQAHHVDFLHSISFERHLSF